MELYCVVGLSGWLVVSTVLRPSVGPGGFGRGPKANFNAWEQTVPVCRMGYYIR